MRWRAPVKNGVLLSGRDQEDRDPTEEDTMATTKRSDAPAKTRKLKVVKGTLRDLSPTKVDVKGGQKPNISMVWTACCT